MNVLGAVWSLATILLRYLIISVNGIVHLFLWNGSKFYSNPRLLISMICPLETTLMYGLLISTHYN